MLVDPFHELVVVGWLGVWWRLSDKCKLWTIFFLILVLIGVSIAVFV